MYLSNAAAFFLLLTADFCRYGVSPFEYALGESGGSLQLAIVNAQIKWPAGPKPPYPEALHQFVTWMLQPQAAVRPRIDDIIIHVDKLISKFSN
jgi:serine/threonine kinase 16